MLALLPEAPLEDGVDTGIDDDVAVEPTAVAAVAACEFGSTSGGGIRPPPDYGSRTSEPQGLEL